MDQVLRTHCAEKGGGWEVLLVARIKDGGSWVESGSCRGGVSIIKETPRGFFFSSVEEEEERRRKKKI